MSFFTSEFKILPNPDPNFFPSHFSFAPSALAYKYQGPGLNWIYPAILLSFVAWRVYKRKQKKAKKAAAKVKALEYRAKKGGLSDAEFTALGRGSDSMGGGMGGPPASQGDAWADMGGSGYSGGAVDKELLDLYDD